MANYDYSRERLVSDMKSVLADAEELLSAAGSESRDKIVSIRPRAQAAILRGKERLAELEAGIEARARQGIRDVDAYATEHPWTTAGTAAAVGALIGATIALLIGRR